MKREIVETADGSFTFKIEGAQECFHSTNGAYTESMHIYIKNGLKYYIDNILKSTKLQTAHINILDIGFGTGLNCILTAVAVEEQRGITINYNAIEKYPLSIEEFELLNYKTLLANPSSHNINMIHTCSWAQKEKIEENFFLKKIKCDIKDLELNNSTKEITHRPVQLIDNNLANIVYFDAFSPNIQPQLWSVDIFKGLYNLMSDNSILVTYSAKGDVKRALREAGFNVTRKEGPPGKRHITVARKVINTLGK